MGGGMGGGQNMVDQILRGLLGYQPMPEAERLQQVVDNHGSKSETRQALDRFLEARKRKQADLNKAQEDLRQYLTFRQEATLVLIGILD